MDERGEANDLNQTITNVLLVLIVPWNASSSIVGNIQNHQPLNVLQRLLLVINIEVDDGF